MVGMTGMNAATGKHLDGLAHLRQSISDILRTPLGTRVMRREYGSGLFELIDRPVNRTWLVEAYAAVVAALDRWEPRFKLKKIKMQAVAAGTVTLDLTGIYLVDGKQVVLEGIII